MNIGMLWYCNDKQKTLEQAILEATTYYQNKYGKAATVVFANPGDVKIEIAVNGIAVKPDKSIPPKHYWIGTEIQP